MGILKVAYVGQNQNGTSISKEVFERSLNTIYNCPIVCNYNSEDDEIGGHDLKIVSQRGEKPKIVNITQPIGVIPESAAYWWETVEDVTGIHDYLCIEALIWKRQEAYQKIKDNVITSQSMEIRIKSGYMQDGIFIIESFEFLAFCLLERDKPCYESASLEMFNKDEFRLKYAEMLEEFKQNFNTVNTSIQVGINTQNNLKGGKELLDQKIELLTKFGLKAEDANFDLESMSLEELEAELNKGNQHESFSLSAEQFKKQLISMLQAEKVDTPWGKDYRYFYFDHDTEANEVYCYDSKDWNLYGFTYSVNGDNITVNFETAKRKKVIVADFDEGDPDFTYREIFEDIADRKTSGLEAKFERARTELEEKYNSASGTIKELNTELDELRSYKQQKMTEERSAAEDAVFSMFTELNGVDAFESLRNNCADFSIEEIEEKCYAILGRNRTHTFSSKTHTPRLPIERKDAKGGANEPYGGLFLKFPPRN